MGAIVVMTMTWQDWYRGLLIASQEGRGDLDARLARAKALVDRRFSEPLDLEILADQAHISRFHFLRLFKETYAQTPHQYLTQKRLQHAKLLLETTDLSVTRICLDVGFSSLGSFSALFRKHHGLSPAHYRRRSVLSLGLPKRIPGCFLFAFSAPLEVSNIREASPSADR